LKHAIRILQRQVVIDFFRQQRQRRGRGAVSSSCTCGLSARIIPASAVITVFLRVKPGENAIRVGGQSEVGLDDERGIREVDQILFCDAVVFDRIVDHAAEEDDIRAGANLAE
jgi:hypothetical protein